MQILKAIGVTERNGAGLRDYFQTQRAKQVTDGTSADSHDLVQTRGPTNDYVIG